MPKSSSPKASNNTRMITIQISVTTLVVAFVLLAGSITSLVVWPRVMAEPTPQEKLRMSSDVGPKSGIVTAFAAAAKAVENSVVHITTEDLDFEGETLGRASGSGVIVDTNGYIITNHHVIQDASRIRVRFRDGQTARGKVIGSDEATDIAVVKVNVSNLLPASKIGDSERLVVGEPVLAIGSPFGLEQTVTSGIISAKERITNEQRNFQQFLQTDAAINPGNSGGPLINLAGEVIGINSQIATSRGSFEGIGFAVPSAIFVEVYNQLITTGRVVRGFLGVVPVKVTPQFAQVYKLKDINGAVIGDLSDPQGPAARAGLRNGDVVVEIGNYTVKDELDLIRRVVSMPVNQPIPVRFYRNGKIQQAEVRLTERQPLPSGGNGRPKQLIDNKPRLVRSGEDKDKSNQSLEAKLGMDVAMLGELRAKKLGNKDTIGALVRMVDPEGMAADAGLRDGDVIKEVNRQMVNNYDDYREITGRLKSGEPLVIFIERTIRVNTSRRYISLTIP
jgi:serine protease Do